MLRTFLILIGVLLTSVLSAQNLSLVDLLTLMNGSDIVKKDAFLSQRGFSFSKRESEFYNYWKSINTPERVFIFISKNTVVNVEYYTEDANCVSTLFADIEKAGNYQRYYPTVENKNLIVTFFKNKSNNRFITIKKDITAKNGDSGWEITFSISPTAVQYN